MFAPFLLISNLYVWIHACLCICICLCVHTHTCASMWNNGSCTICKHKSSVPCHIKPGGGRQKASNLEHARASNQKLQHFAHAVWAFPNLALHSIDYKIWGNRFIELSWPQNKWMINLLSDYYWMVQWSVKRFKTVWSSLQQCLASSNSCFLTFLSW